MNYEMEGKDPEGHEMGYAHHDMYGQEDYGEVEEE